MGVPPDRLPESRPLLRRNGLLLPPQVGDRVRRGDLGSIAFLEQAFEPTDTIRVDGDLLNVPPIIRESQGPISNSLQDFFGEYMAGDYAAVIEGLPILKRDYWDPCLDAIPVVEGDGYAFAFGMGKADDMEAVLKKFNRGKVVGIDMDVGAMEEGRRRLAQNHEYDGRVAYLQADLGQPIRMIPSGIARIITCRAVELFMPRDGIVNMLGEAARISESNGQYHSNNLLMPFDEVLKRMAQYEIEHFGMHEGVRRIMEMAKYAPIIDKYRTSGQMYAASLEEQQDMLREAGFTEVSSTELTSEAIVDPETRLRKPFAATVIASVPRQKLAA